MSAIAPYVADAIAGVASSGISSAALTSRALGREEIAKLLGYEAQKTLAGAVIDGASRAFGGAYSGGSSFVTVPSSLTGKKSNSAVFGQRPFEDARIS